MEEFHCFDFKKKKWIKINDKNDKNRPSFRSHHQCCIYQDQMILIGGSKNQNEKELIYYYNFETNKWKKEKVKNLNNLKHTSLTIRIHTLYIFGKYSNQHDRSLFSIDLLLNNKQCVQLENIKIEKYSNETELKLINSEFNLLTKSKNNFYVYNILKNEWYTMIEQEYKNSFDFVEINNQMIFLENKNGKLFIIGKKEIPKRNISLNNINYYDVVFKVGVHSFKVHKIIMNQLDYFKKLIDKNSKNLKNINILDKEISNASIFNRIIMFLYGTEFQIPNGNDLFDLYVISQFLKFDKLKLFLCSCVKNLKFDELIICLAKVDSHLRKLRKKKFESDPLKNKLMCVFMEKYESLFDGNHERENEMLNKLDSDLKIELLTFHSSSDSKSKVNHFKNPFLYMNNLRKSKKQLDLSFKLNDKKTIHCHSILFHKYPLLQTYFEKGQNEIKIYEEKMDEKKFEHILDCIYNEKSFDVQIEFYKNKIICQILSSNLTFYNSLWIEFDQKSTGKGLIILDPKSKLTRNGLVAWNGSAIGPKNCLAFAFKVISRVNAYIMIGFGNADLNLNKYNYHTKKTCMLYLNGFRLYGHKAGTAMKNVGCKVGDVFGCSYQKSKNLIHWFRGAETLGSMVFKIKSTKGLTDIYPLIEFSQKSVIQLVSPPFEVKK